MKDNWKNDWNELKKYIKKNKMQFIVLCVISAIISSAFWYFVLYSPKETPDEITYNEFLEYIENGDVDTVTYSPYDEYMTVTLFNDETRDMTKEERQEYKYDISDERICLYPGYEDFRKDMLLADINMIVDDSSSSSVYNMIYMAVEIAFPVILILVMFSAAKGQFKGTSEKELIQTSDVTFDDIIGHEEIIDDVKFVTELIKDPSKGDKVGAKLPKGLLLVGPPGTGKTLLAKAMAHEADVPFLYQNASGFIEMYVGLGARRVRELFKIARKNAPCILFIDEIDAIGGKRGNAKGTSENEQTIDAILQEMDGFTSRDGVFIIAATNRPDELDEALVRSGRFDRQITVSPPRDWMVRRDLFKHYLNKFSVRDDVDIDSLSKQVSGFTGADIAMICNEASIIAVMHDKDCIDMDCIEEAIDKKIFKGSRSKKNAYEKDRHIIAYHEAGHAVMSWLLHEPIARASIQSTISGVGGAVFNEDKDTLFMTDMDMMNRIMIAYAGRVSEDIKFKNVTTGASNDITQATEIMLQYIEKYGFDREFGLLDISILTKEHLVNSDAVTEKMRTMSLKLYDETYDILNRHYAKVEVLAQKLLEVETLSGSEIEELIA